MIAFAEGEPRFKIRSLGFLRGKTPGLELLHALVVIANSQLSLRELWKQ
jgi:hypothetical protein